VVVNDVKTDKRSADAFFLFGLSSILVVPVVLKDVVTGIYCIGSIGKQHIFSDEEVKKCNEIINSSKLKIPYGEVATEI
jgi:acetolactate synthase-1/2/3 large subunit